MNPHAANDNSQTLTNPRLTNNHPQSPSINLTNNIVKQQQQQSNQPSFFSSNPQNFSPSSIQPLNKNVSNISLGESSDFLQMFSLARNRQVERLKQEEHDYVENARQGEKGSERVNDSAPKSHQKREQTFRQAQKQHVFSTIVKFNQDQPIISTEQTNLFDNELDEDFLLAGADLQRIQIVLRIEQRLTNSSTTSEIDHSSNPKFQQEQNQQRQESQRGYEKMQIEHQNPKPNQNAIKIESNNSIEPNIQDVSPKVNLKQIKISLNDSKQKRQLRRLTPINSLKKFILDKFGYSQGVQNCQKLQLSFFNLYPNQPDFICMPIINEENLEIILSEYIKARRDIFLMFENDGSLKKKVQRKNHQNKEAYQVQFDSDGQLEDGQESLEEDVDNINGEQVQFNEIKLIRKMIFVNKTDKSRYRGTKMVRCAFCNKANEDIDSIKICGPFYGPFYQGRQKSKRYCHLLCALWCKKVFLNDNNELEKIPAQITRSKSKKCQYCQQKGAGLLCNGCNLSMHYECGLGKCQYLWATYELYCQGCKEEPEIEAMEIEENGNEVNNRDQESNTHTQSLIKSQKQSHFSRFKAEQSLKKQQMQQNSIVSAHSLQIVQSFQVLPLQKLDQTSLPQSLGQGVKLQLQKQPKSQPKIDPSSRIQINNYQRSQQMEENQPNEESSSNVEILQHLCKAARHKPSMMASQVKQQQAEESQLNGRGGLRRRGRKPK